MMSPDEVIVQVMSQPDVAAPTFSLLLHGDNVDQEQTIHSQLKTKIFSSCFVACNEPHTVLLAAVDGGPIVSPNQFCSSAQLTDTQDTLLTTSLLLIAELGAFVDGRL